MKRPTIKDVAASRYADYLEAKLEAMSSESTKTQSYYALKSFIEANCVLVKDLKITSEDLDNKDSRIADRVMKFINEILSHNKNLDELEKMITPVIISDGKKQTGSLLEKSLND